MSKRPTLCRQLIVGIPHYVGYSDSCLYGTGGVWVAGKHTLHPCVWRLKWPDDIVALLFHKDTNPTGTLTINDLEMAGILLQFLVLEALVPLKHSHVSIWCDNMSAVAWTRNMGSSRSEIGHSLARALSIRICHNESSPLAAAHIAGKDNDMADLASRTFKQQDQPGNYDIPLDEDFLTLFNTRYPLTQQDTSWLMLRLRSNITTRVFSILRGKPKPPESWVRLPAYALDTGAIGSPTAGASTKAMEWTRYSANSPLSTKLTSSPLLPQLYVKEDADEDIKCALVRYKTRYAPSARSMRWLDSPTPSMPPMAKPNIAKP